MVEASRPNIFPECERCPVASSAINKIRIDYDPTKIWVRCLYSKFLWVKKVKMGYAFALNDPESPDNGEYYTIIGQEDNVTRFCPGIKGK